MDDLISRAEAIDALMEILDRPNHAEFLYTDEICRALNTLSSAQPELSDEEKRLIKQLRSYHNGSYAAVLDKLMAFAQPMRKKGEWICTGENEEWYAIEYICSECGDTMLGEANFCPNCGCQMMRGDADEID